ncbi:uncharacterized protein LOC115738313 isoform X3 [Rhodamnia argentea]|nr:uncharacterized protein LOC115738313 isoform X3 [Rhodamnia argentea]
MRWSRSTHERWLLVSCISVECPNCPQGSSLEIELLRMGKGSCFNGFEDVATLMSWIDGAHFQDIQRRNRPISSALPETAISIAVAATAVGAAATLLIKRTKASEETEIPMKTCEDCGGSGICSECKGEGFVLKRLSEQSAEKARLTAKNMATRYTAA